MSRGVLADTNMPIQNKYSDLAIPASANVGTSGNWDDRFAVLTAKGTNLPALIIGKAETKGAKK